jgi:hypothetical protein
MAVADSVGIIIIIVIVIMIIIIILIETNRVLTAVHTCFQVLYH